MSQQAQTSNQQIIVIGLVVIAALLAAIIGVVIYQQTTAIPAPTAQATTGAPDAGTAPADQSAMGAMGAMGGSGQAAAPEAFDPKTATKVPEGTEPEAYVKAYYEACDKGDWQAAFDALPAAKKAGNSPDALKEQVTGYGIKSYEITDATVEGDKATITVDQVTGQYGTFVNQWTFVKDGGAWLVESKAVTGMK